MGITVRGIPEVQRNLESFPRLLVLNCFQVALSRAIAVIEEEVRTRTPESDYSTSSEEYGHLLDNLMSEVTIDTQGRGGFARVSFGKKSYVALFIEYGHRMVTHGGKDTGKFVQANPFMRQAFEAAADKAFDVFAETVREYMDGNHTLAA